MYRRHLKKWPHESKGPVDALPVRHVGPGLDRWRGRPPEHEHNQLDRSIDQRSAVAVLRPDRRPQAGAPAIVDAVAAFLKEADTRNLGGDDVSEAS